MEKIEAEITEGERLDQEIQDKSEDLNKKKKSKSKQTPIKESVTSLLKKVTWLLWVGGLNMCSRLKNMRTKLRKRIKN